MSNLVLINPKINMKINNLEDFKNEYLNILKNTDNYNNNILINKIKSLYD